MATADIPRHEIGRAQIAGLRNLLEGKDHLHVRPLGDGRAVFLLQMAFGNLRVAIGEMDALYYDDGWCYQAEQAHLAWLAALGWDGEDEPEGWYRHPNTGRRRPGGDPAKETVRC